MDLIDNDVRDSLEVCISAGTQPPEEDTSRTEEKLAIWPSPPLATDSVADAALGLVDVLEPLLGNTGSDAERRHSSWLCNHDRGRATTAGGDLVVCTGSMRDKVRQDADALGRGTPHQG